MCSAFYAVEIMRMRICSFLRSQIYFVYYFVLVLFLIFIVSPYLGVICRFLTYCLVVMHNCIYVITSDHYHLIYFRKSSVYKKYNCILEMQNTVLKICLT